MLNFERPKHRFFFQLIIWLTLNILFYWIPQWMTVGKYRFRLNDIILITQLMLIGLNTFIFFPKLFLKNKKIVFVIIISTIILAISRLIIPQDVIEPDLAQPPERYHPDFYILFMNNVLSIFAAVLGSIFFEMWMVAQQRSKENIRLINENLNTELKFLKSQINPHFLFNALNNIYGLSLLKLDKTPESIAQLSDILRYVIYDCEKEKVSLNKELDYIRDYIALFQLKKENKLPIQLTLHETPIDVQIPPMLFIPFIENALKHSYIENLKDSWITIQLAVRQPKQLHFIVRNSIPTISIQKDKVGGIGLENVKRRLFILFPNGKHNLKIKEEGDVFEVQLLLFLT